MLVLVVYPATLAGCSAGSPAAPYFMGTSPIVPATGDASSGGEDAASQDATSEGATSDGGAVDISAVFAACKPNPTTGDFPPAVAAVLTARCQPCHQNPPLNGAPFPLLTYQDVNAAFGSIPIYEEMYLLTQPDGNPHMPFRTAPQLSADQLQTLSSWLLSCAPPAK